MKWSTCMGRFLKVPPLRTDVSEAPSLLLSYGVVGCGVWVPRCRHPYLVTFGDVGGHHG